MLKNKLNLILSQVYERAPGKFEVFDTTSARDYGNI